MLLVQSVATQIFTVVVVTAHSVLVATATSAASVRAVHLAYGVPLWPANARHRLPTCTEVIGESCISVASSSVKCRCPRLMLSPVRATRANMPATSFRSFSGLNMVGYFFATANTALPLPSLMLWPATATCSPHLALTFSHSCSMFSAWLLLAIKPSKLRTARLTHSSFSRLTAAVCE